MQVIEIIPQEIVVTMAIPLSKIKKILDNFDKLKLNVGKEEVKELLELWEFFKTIEETVEGKDNGTG